MQRSCDCNLPSPAGKVCSSELIENIRLVCVKCEMQPSNLDCDRAITPSSQIMGKLVQESADHGVKIKGLECGAEVKEGQCLEIDYTSTGGEFIIEVEGSTIQDGVCEGKRQRDSVAKKVSINPAGKGTTVSVRAAWAKGYGQVRHALVLCNTKFWHMCMAWRLSSAENEVVIRRWSSGAVLYTGASQCNH